MSHYVYFHISITDALVGAMSLLVPSYSATCAKGTVIEAFIKVLLLFFQLQLGGQES